MRELSFVEVEARRESGGLLFFLNVWGLCVLDCFFCFVLSFFFEIFFLVVGQSGRESI